MNQVLLSIPYLAASVLFILSLKGLASQQTARRGNWLGMVGMAIAVVATVSAEGVSSSSLIYEVIVVLVGAAVGTVMALRVAMTAMPEMVALLHSFVGAAAVLVGFGSWFGEHGQTELGRVIHDTEVFVAVWIGAITFTGSVVAFAKLRGTLGGQAAAVARAAPAEPGAVLASLVLGRAVRQDTRRRSAAAC